MQAKILLLIDNIKIMFNVCSIVICLETDNMQAFFKGNTVTVNKTFRISGGLKVFFCQSFGMEHGTKCTLDRHEQR